MNHLDLTIAARTGTAHVRFLKRNVLAAHALLNTRLTDLSLALVGDRVMSDLHLRFMNIPGPTDVLTFPLDVDSRGRATTGEVIVCVPEAVRQSQQCGVPLRHELLLYALHGMLHLSGFDDRTVAGHRKMHHAEDQILTRLGIGATFHHRPRGKKTSRP